MTNLLKSISVLLAIAAVAVTLSGCGEKNETNVPSVKLAASASVSQTDVSAHTHTVSIPFSSIFSTPTADIQIRSETTNGHSHVIALSPQQVLDLSNGMILNLTSSSPDTGTDHKHTWSIQGGSVLYEKNCYNCHTNDKRGHNPMNVSLNTSQTSALKNPSAATVSTSPAAVPDSAFSSSTTVSLDGPTLYAANCSSCHGPLATSSKFNRTAAQIKLAMGTMGLSDAQLQAIATALIK